MFCLGGCLCGPWGSAGGASSSLSLGAQIQGSGAGRHLLAKGKGQQLGCSPLSSPLASLAQEDFIPKQDTYLGDAGLYTD